MLRKLTIILCLISFAPAAVGAQGLATLVTPPAVVGSAPEMATPLPREINLSLPAERTAVLLGAADTTQSAVTGNVPEQKCESRSSHSWDNFVDVHFGGYRWIWWAGAAVVLGVIHAGAD